VEAEIAKGLRVEFAVDQHVMQMVVGVEGQHITEVIMPVLFLFLSCFDENPDLYLYLYLYLAKTKITLIPTAPT
jgi:hypothetical protein